MSDRINLILLEFFVDGVKLDNNLKSSISNYKYGKLCVLFKFLDFPPLQVNEDDVPDGQIALEPVFRSGRSGLFSVPDVTNITPDLLLVDVFVVLKLPDGNEPDKIAIGQTKINLTQHFTCITSEAKLHPEKAPVTRSVRESFLIADSHQKFVGVVSLLIRASCFGNMIVQQFKRNYPRKMTDGPQGMAGEVVGPRGHSSGGGDRAMGAAVLKETLEKTLPENLSQVLPEGLIDVIANCFSTNSNSIPVGLLESLRQGIVQGVRGVTGANYDPCAPPLQTIPEASSATDTAVASPTATATSSSTTAAAAGTRSSPSLNHQAARSPPTPLTPPAQSTRTPCQGEAHTPPMHPMRKLSGYLSRESLGYRDSSVFTPHHLNRCGSPVQFPSSAAVHASSLGRLHSPPAHMSLSADRCVTPIQFPSRFDAQGSGERLFAQPTYSMESATSSGQPTAYARHSGMMLARDTSRSASKMSERSSSLMHEELIRAHTGLYGGNEIVLNRNLHNGARVTTDGFPQPESPSDSPAVTGGGAYHDRTTVPQGRLHRNHHRHHHHRHRRIHKTRSSGKATKPHQVGTVPAPPTAGLPIAGLPTMSPQMEMHMQRMVQRKSGHAQPISTPLQQLQERVAAVVSNQQKTPGGQSDDVNKFDVIGTELGGMMLRIHVPKSKKVEGVEGSPFPMLVPSPGARASYPATSAPGTPTNQTRPHHHHHHHRHHHHHHHHRRHHHHHHHNRYHQHGDAADSLSPPHSEVNVRISTPDDNHHFVIKDGKASLAKREIGPGGRRVIVDESGGGGAAARRFAGKDNANRRFHAKDDTLRHTRPFLFPSRLFDYKSGDRGQLKRDYVHLPRCYRDRDAKGAGRSTQYVYRDIPSRYNYGRETESYNLHVTGPNLERAQASSDLGHVIAEAARAVAMKNVRVTEVHPDALKPTKQNDADSDVYVLKIGNKRSEKKKETFELTMRTPKKVESEVARPEATGPPFIKVSVPQKNRSKSKGSISNASSKREKRARRVWRPREKEKGKKIGHAENRQPQNVAA